MAQTNKKLRLGVINGSLRLASRNAGLARYVESVRPLNIQFVNIRIDDLPLFNQDLEIIDHTAKTVSHPESATTLRNDVRGVDALLFTSPENNGGVTSALKNAYDWLSRDYNRFGISDSTPVGNGKKLGVIGASYVGEGSLNDVKRMVEYLKLAVFPQTFYTKLGNNFDAEGNLVENTVKERLALWAQEFFNFVQA